MSSRRRLTIILVLALCGSSRSAAAQTVRPDRPFRGLFGAGDRPEGKELLSLDWGLLGGYDNNLANDLPAPTDAPVVSGAYTSATGALRYGMNNEHKSFSATALSSVRYYPDLHELNGVDTGADVAFTADLGRRTTIELGQRFAHQPYYGIDFIGALAPSMPAAVDAGGSSSQAALSSNSSNALDGRARLTRGFGPRTSVAAEYSYRRMNFSGGDDSFRWQLANVSFSRSLTRDAVLRLGYGYGVGGNGTAFDRTTGEFTDGLRTVNHNLDLGVDYNRRLSFSRKTQLNFSTGSTGVVDSNATTYRLIGTAGLTHEIGRSWRANASYNRGVQYLPGFDGTFFADTAQVRVAGLVHRRIEASGYGGYSAGRVGSRAAESYSSSTAGGDLRVAMSRTLSVFAEYMYYRYGFDTGVQVPFGLPPQLNRQAIRFGISGWLPLAR